MVTGDMHEGKGRYCACHLCHTRLYKHSVLTLLCKTQFKRGIEMRKAAARD